MKKRREMGKDKDIKSKIEYTEHCKTIRKNLKQEIRKHNTRKVERAIEENKSIRNAKRDITLRNKI